MSDKYILVGQTPVPCDDVLEWARWFETTDRVVFQDEIGQHLVSTVFLGLDHNFMRRITGVGEPLLFETMVFCHHEPVCELDQRTDRYSTWLEAETGHKAEAAHVRAHVQARTS